MVGSLSVVIPARNEMDNVGRLVTRIRETFWFLEDLEIIVVDDHSTDATAKEASDAGASVIFNQGLRGYGHTVRLGLRMALNDWVTIMVADGSDDPADLLKMWLNVNEHVDAILGHRFMKGAMVTDYPWVKRIANRLGNRLAALMLYTSYTDLTNPFKIFRNAFVQAQLNGLTATDFSLGLELTARFIQDRRPFIMVPINWKDRTIGTSKFRVKHALGFLRTLYYVVSTHAPLL